MRYTRVVVTADLLVEDVPASTIEKKIYFIIDNEHSSGTPTAIARASASSVGAIVDALNATEE